MDESVDANTRTKLHGSTGKLLLAEHRLHLSMLDNVASDYTQKRKDCTNDVEQTRENRAGVFLTNDDHENFQV